MGKPARKQHINNINSQDLQELVQEVLEIYAVADQLLMMLKNSAPRIREKISHNINKVVKRIDEAMPFILSTYRKVIDNQEKVPQIELEKARETLAPSLISLAQEIAQASNLLKSL